MTEAEESSANSEEFVDYLSVENHRIPIPTPHDISIPREVCFIFIVCLAQILTQCGVSQTINAGVDIASTFGVEDKAGEVSWFSAAYSLTVGTFILISGRLGDIYGYKLLFCLGFCWFGVWSLVCGFAGFTSSRVFFDVARALQGMGPAFTMPNGTALIGHYYPPGIKKTIAMCLFGAVAPSGFVLGAIFSGIFTQLVWWPWLFWVCGIVCFVVAVAAFFAIPKRIGTPHGKFDWAGSITGVLGLVLINFAWNQGPNVGWDKPYVYVLLIIGFIFLGLFYVAIRRADDPLVDPSVLKGEVGIVLLCIVAGWSCFGIWLFYTFKWAEVVDGLNPILRAVQFIPAMVGGLAAASITAVLLHKTPSSVVMFISMLAFFTGITLMGTRPVGQIYWAQKFVSICVQCLGMDMSFPAACIILSNTFPKSQQGVAGSLVSTFVNYSISIGLGIAGTVEYYTTKGKPESLETTIYGIRRAFYMGMGLAGLGVVCGVAFLITQLTETRKKKNEETLEPEKVDSDCT